MLRTILLWEYADFGTYFGEFFALKYGRLDRKTYYCTLAAIAEIQLIIVMGLIFLLPVLLKDMDKIQKALDIMDSILESPKTSIPVLVWILLTPFQLSGFIRRMNDARWSKIWAFLLAIPFIGNVLCMLIGIIADD